MGDMADRILDAVRDLIGAAQHPDIKRVHRYNTAQRGVQITYASDAKR